MFDLGPKKFKRPNKNPLIIFACAAFLMFAAWVISDPIASDDESSETSAGETSFASIKMAPIAASPAKEESQKPEFKFLSKEEVARIIRERNAGNEALMRELKNEGWEPVEVDDPPDETLIALNPSLLNDREEELQVQIQSNSYSGESLVNLLTIATDAWDEKTRYVAIEALGRSTDERAQTTLIDLYEQTTDDETRSQILGYLLPKQAENEVAEFLAGQAANTALPESLRRQAAFPLAVFALAQNGDRAETIRNQMPLNGRSDFVDILELLETGDGGVR